MMGKEKNVTNLYFEEIEAAEEMWDAKDYGTLFGVGFVGGVIIFIAAT